MARIKEFLPAGNDIDSSKTLFFASEISVTSPEISINKNELSSTKMSRIVSNAVNENEEKCTGGTCQNFTIDSLMEEKIFEGIMLI